MGALGDISNAALGSQRATLLIIIASAEAYCKRLNLPADCCSVPKQASDRVLS